MFCWHCGAQVPDQALFCPKCGKSLKPGTSQPEQNEDTRQKRNGSPDTWQQFLKKKELTEAKKRLTGVLIGLAVILVVGLGAMLLKPGGGSAGSPRSTPSPSPSPSASASPSPKPSAEPSPEASGSAVTTGTYTYKSGAVYEGEMKDGLPNGYGVITFDSGDRYEGEVVNGKRDGLGTYFFDSGATFEGHYENDKRHGPGSYTFVSGAELFGIWEKGSKEGEFTRIESDGTRYRETYKNDERISREEIDGSSKPSASPTPSAPPKPSALPKPSASAKPTDTELLIPDFGAFCGGDADFYLEDNAGTTQKKGYTFKPNSTVVEEYLALLESDYKFTLEKTRTGETGNSYITYGYAYTGSKHVTSVDQSFKGLECEVSVTEFDDRTQIVIRYGYQLSYTDPGVRTTKPTESDKPAGSGGGGGGGGGGGSFVPDASRLPCLTCGGSKKCPECGGDGYLWSSASGKEDRNCWKCHNHNGRCPTCDGSGYR